MNSETKNTVKENVLLIVSYALSKILQFLFKCNVYIFGLAEGDDNVTLDYASFKAHNGEVLKRWTHKNPFLGIDQEEWYSTYFYSIFSSAFKGWDMVGGRYLHGKFSHSIKAEFGVHKAFWLLELDKGKVQEIDVVEFMKPKRAIITWINEKIKQVNIKLKWNISELPNPPVRGVYFSIYNNEVSNKYYYDKEETQKAYRRFQTRMRSKFICDYLESKKVNYSIKWSKNKVVWYIDGLPVAVSFVYIPVQPMYIILSNIV